MELGMSSAAFYGRMNTEDAAGHLCSFPIDTCEVFLQTFSEYNAEFGRIVRNKLGNLKCTSVHAKGTQFELDLFADYVRQRNDAFRLFEGICSAGKEMGASYYVLHGPPGFRKSLRPEQIRNLKNVFPEMQKIAGKYGMEILWENVFWCACSLPEHVRTLMEFFPDIRFVLDIKQAYQAGTDPMEMAATMGTHLAHVHVLDWDTEGRLVLPGEGVFDFETFARVLRSFHYTGAVILEPYSSQTLDEERVCTSLKHLQNIIA